MPRFACCPSTVLLDLKVSAGLLPDILGPAACQDSSGCVQPAGWPVMTPCHDPSADGLQCGTSRPHGAKSSDPAANPIRSHLVPIGAWPGTGSVGCVHLGCPGPSRVGRLGARDACRLPTGPRRVRGRRSLLVRSLCRSPTPPPRGRLPRVVRGFGALS
jgi:hypothetical protein